MMDDARKMLDFAARLAWRGVGDVEPNPPVGCVIVRGGIIGMGHHRRFGGLHAEREALADCRRRGIDPRGATVYVTLEPCCHHGKTPPCTEALIEAGVGRAVIARADPSSVSGGGAEVLRRAGIEVEFTDASRAAVELTDPFVQRVSEGLPWVIAKWAQTIDGRVATRTGASKWISNEWSRSRVHRLRARVDAVLTGIGTVLADDPLLTARGVRRVRRIARRVVVDPGLRIPPRCALVRSVDRAPLTVACDAAMLDDAAGGQRQRTLTGYGVEVIGLPRRGDRLDPRTLLAFLAEEHDAANVLVESGPGLLGSLFGEGLVNEAAVFVGPLVLADDRAVPVAGGHVAEALADGVRLAPRRVKRLDDDLLLHYKVVGKS